MNNQAKINDFFSSKKTTIQNPGGNNNNNNSGKYIPLNNDYKPKKEPSPLKFHIPKENESYLAPSYQASNTSNINLEECRTYALPFHIPRIWKIIQPKLRDMRQKKIVEISAFCEVIRTIIQSHYSNPLKNLNLQVLSTYLDKLSPNEIHHFFDKLLPFLAGLALEAETLFDDPLLILKQNQNQTVQLSKRQAACLVSHMFFCTLHQQNNNQLRHDCNFTNLYRDSRKKPVKIEKLKCVFNYFRRLQESLPSEVITFERLVLKPKVHGTVNFEFWQRSRMPLRKCIVKDTGSIEDETREIQVDFANRVIGGGVLDGGCVQEEIRFLIGPELLVSMLITENLLDHEAVLMTGTDIYGRYIGYSDKFKFVGDHRSKIPSDNFDRKDCMVLAIDAIDFSRTSSTRTQFKRERILREINKAFIGFWGSETENGEKKKKISTGRWGCGAFQGDSQLKFLLQWLAASQAEREMIFYRFEDKLLSKAQLVIRQCEDLTVGELFERIDQYNQMITREKEGSMDLFEFLLTVDS